MMDPEVTHVTRHRASHEVANLWRQGLRFSLVPMGSPPVRFDFSPRDHSVTMRTPLSGPEPDVTRWRQLSVARRMLDGEDYFDLTVSVSGFEIEAAYALLTDTADGIQVGSQTLAYALTSSLHRYATILGKVAALSTEREVGLVGELTVLTHLLHLGVPVTAWVGPLAEEHDFALTDCALECKSTTSERRNHVISGLGQLTPSPGQPLYLVSAQLTRSAPGLGKSLPQHVDEVRGVADQQQDDLELLLYKAGWREEEAGLYTTYWSLRTEVHTYLVDQDFPRISASHLGHVPGFASISDITYRIDITERPSDPAPSALQGLVNVKDIVK